MDKKEPLSNLTQKELKGTQEIKKADKRVSFSAKAKNWGKCTSKFCQRHKYPPNQR